MPSTTTASALPETTPRWPTRVIAEYVAIAVASQIISALSLRLWRLDWRVPYEYAGDAVQKLASMKTAVDAGWLFSSDSLAAPFSYQAYDFARFDSLNYLVIWLLAKLLGDFVVAANLYFVASFTAVALSAYWVLRRLDVSAAPAGAASLLYAFLPFSLQRGMSHFTNGAYFFVPLACWILLSAICNRARDFSGRRLIGMVVIGLLMPLQNPYFAFFFVTLLGGATLLGQVSRLRKRTIVGALIVTFAVGISTFIEQSPRLVYQSTHGRNEAAAFRTPGASQTYALTLGHLLLPNYQHRLASLRTFKQHFDYTFGDNSSAERPQSASPFFGANERVTASLGLIGDLGLLLILASLVRALSSRTSARPHRETVLVGLAGLALLALTYAVAGGWGQLVSYLFVPEIRALNRISVFIAFFSLAGVALWVESYRAKLSRAAMMGLSGAVLAIGIWDQTSPQMIVDHAAVQTQFRRDARYVLEVEQRLAPRAAVFQLPGVSYPEAGPTWRMNDYDHFRPYLHASTLRWSYGTMRGRGPDYHNQLTARLPAKEMVARLKAEGFSAIWVDRFGYQDEGRAILSELSPLIGGVTSASEDGRYVTLFTGIDSPAEPPPPAPYSLGSIVDFTNRGRPEDYFALNWSAPEPWGTWTSGRQAQLELRLEEHAPGELTLLLECQAFIGAGGNEQFVDVFANGENVAHWVFRDGAPTTCTAVIPERITTLSNVLSLSFEIQEPRSPLRLGMSPDFRPLGLGVRSLLLRK